MSMSDNFFKTIKDVVTLTTAVDGLSKNVNELRVNFHDMDKRLVRLETMVEIARSNQLTKKQ